MRQRRCFSRPSILTERAKDEESSDLWKQNLVSIQDPEIMFDNTLIPISGSGFNSEWDLISSRS